MSLHLAAESTPTPDAEAVAPPPPASAPSWSQQLKERLERLAKATSAPVDLYPGTPAYNTARKLEEAIEATWRAYLVELVRNDLAAGVVTGRRKHYWEKNECLIVYELIEGSRLEEFPSSDVAKREEYLAHTVRDALYIKVPQFSGGPTFPWPSSTVSFPYLRLSCHFRVAATVFGPKLNSGLVFFRYQNSKSKLPNPAADDAIAALDQADVKLRAASLATPPQSPPPEDEGSLRVPQQPTQRRTVSLSSPQTGAPDDAIAARASHIQLPQSAGDKITTPSVVLAAPAHHAHKSTSAPNSPIAPPSALASALIGVGSALALGSSSPRVHTSEADLSDSSKEGRSPPVLSITSPSSQIVSQERTNGALGLSTGGKEVPQSPLDQAHNGEHEDHEEATIQRARRASVATATFKTLNPAVGLDTEIECRSRPSSPVIIEISAPELVYYGSGANCEEEGDEHDDEVQLEMFRSLNPHVSLEAEISRRSCSPSPVPEVFIAPQIEEDDELTETFKSLNPAVSLDAEILRRSRTPSPVPQFKELNEELSLEKEIALRAASRFPPPKAQPTERGNGFANDANDAESGPGPVAKQYARPNRSLVRTTLLLPFILGLRLISVFNPFTYLYFLRSRSRSNSTYRPEPYPKIPRSVLKMVVPAFIWRWAGKDPSYNLQRVGLGTGVNSVGTRYDSSGAALPPTST